MKILHSSHLKALLGGGLLTLAFSPFNIWPLAIISPLLLLFALERRSIKQCAIQGLLFGIAFFSGSVSWVYISIHQFGGANWLISTVITAAFILLLALFPAITALGYGLHQNRYPKAKTQRIWLIFPLLWIVSEWLRSHIMTGFPWVLLGDSQANGPLHVFAPIIGSIGLSWLCVLLAGQIHLVTNQKKFRHNPNLIMPYCLFWILLFALGLNASTQHWTYPSKKTVSVSLVQGDIPQSIKWQPNQLRNTLATYLNLTTFKPHLTIWPEAAIPTFPNEVPQFMTLLMKKTQQQHFLLTGAPLAFDHKIFNGALLLGNNHVQHYQKQHLVPFGEYTPLAKYLQPIMQLFAIPMSNFSAGSTNQPLLHMGHINIALLICYEAAYSSLVIHTLTQDKIPANLVVIITDDAWFGHSIASFQHLEIAQMRALETGRYVLIASNNGVTAVIAPNGKLLKQLPRFKRQVLNATVHAMYGETPFIHWHQATHFS